MRRRRVVAGAIVVAALGAVVALVVQSASGGHGHSLSPATSATTAEEPSVPPSSAPPTTVTTYAVGATSLDITEPAVPGRAARALPTSVRFPTTATGGPDRAAGPFPLVVFSGGYDIDPEAFATLLNAWAAAGFVVADPAYPFTTPTSTGGLDERDILNHPGDLTAVITALIDAGERPATARGSTPATASAPAPLAGMVDAGEIGVIGHSDGADVSLTLAADTCCVDHRIDAAVIMSGAESTGFGGSYFTAPSPPMLVVQGTADVTNPPACSVQIYTQASAPKFYLSLLGQTHTSGYLDPGAARDAVQQVTIDFLDGTLKGSSAHLASLPADGNVTGTSALSVGTPPGQPAGACPGAPGN